MPCPFFAQGLPPGQTRNKGSLQNIVNFTANNDPKAAAAIALDLPAGQARNQAISTAVNQWVQSLNPGRRARDWVKTLPPGPAQNEAVQSIAGNMAQSDPQAAANYAAQCSPRPNAQQYSQPDRRYLGPK